MSSLLPLRRHVPSVDEVHTEKVQQQRSDNKVRKGPLMRYSPKFCLVFRVRLHAERGREDELADRCAEAREEGVERLQRLLAPSSLYRPFDSPIEQSGSDVRTKFPTSTT
jgi:hypothetical protein